MKKKKWQVETDGEYIWAENQIQEAYQQRVNKLLKTLHEEAARQGFRVRIEKEEIQFEGTGDASTLCQMAADLSGEVRRVRKEEEDRLRWFRARVLEQIGSGLSDPFILACSKSWQYYDPQKNLWNSVEDGRLCPGQLIQCGCLAGIDPAIDAGSESLLLFETSLEREMPERLVEWGVFGGTAFAG